MATAAPLSPPAWFRIAALVAILWNAFGVFQYLGSVGIFGDPLASLPQAQREAAEAIPAAIIAAFAIGTFSGLIGSVGLFLRKRWARAALLVSLAALVLLEGYIIFLSDALEAFGGIALPLVIVIVAALLAWLAHHALRRGWLR
jgi:hypothetical protein